MRVHRLHVENLGPLEKVDLPLKPVTMLMGPNEAGKSFVLDAFGVLRFGTARGLKVGDNYALTRNGTKGWVVEGTVAVKPGADPILLRRTRTTGPDVATLDGAMGDARVWRALLDGQTFLALAPEERRRIVADLLARDTSDLVEVLTSHGAASDVVEAVRVGNMARAHRLAQESRRALDRLLNEQDVMARSIVEDPEVPTKSGMQRISAVPLQKIDDALGSARTNWTAAVKASAKREAAQRAAADAEEARKALAALGPPPRWEERDAKRLAEIAVSMQKGGEDAAAAAAKAKMLRSQVDSAYDRLKASGLCPSCGVAMTPEAKEAVQASVKVHEKALVALGEDVKRLAEEGDLLRKERTKLAEQKAHAEVYDAEKKALEKRVAAGTATPDEAGADPKALEADVRRLEALRQARVRFDALSEAQIAAQKRVAGLREKVDLAKKIEEMVVPDKIDDEAAALESINAACAEYAPAVMGGPWVSVTPSWDVTYAGMRVELGSDSAKIRTGLVLALALSRLSGVKCVFVDRLEALDDSTRSRVVNLLGALVEKGEIETAIGAVVRKEPPAPSTLPEWLGRVWVQGGMAVAV